MESKEQIISNLNQMQQDLKNKSVDGGNFDWDERPNPMMKYVRKDIIEYLNSQMPDRTKLTMDTLKQYLVSYAEQTKLTEVEKAYFIYYWVGHNIDYDLESFLKGKDTDCSPDSVLKNGKSVCAGYSSLFKTLCDWLGIECYSIPCFAKGLGFQVGESASGKENNHEHNAIKLFGGWCLVDSTWGAGSIIKGKFFKRFNDFYFCCDPKEFIFTHFPSDPSWQLIAQPVSKDQFSIFPLVGKGFFQMGFLSMNPFACAVNTEQMLEVTFDFIPQLKRRLAMSAFLSKENSHKPIPDACLVQKYDNQFKIRIILNEKGVYFVHFMASLTEKGQMSMITKMKITVNKNQSKKLAFPEMPQNYGSLIMESPLFNNIKKGDDVYFKFLSDEAEEVDVVFDDEWIPIQKNANGCFEKCLKAKGKKITICEKKGGKTFPRYTFTVQK